MKPDTVTIPVTLTFTPTRRRGPRRNRPPHRHPPHRRGRSTGRRARPPGHGRQRRYRGPPSASATRSRRPSSRHPAPAPSPALRPRRDARAVGPHRRHQARHRPRVMTRHPLDRVAAAHGVTIHPTDVAPLTPRPRLRHGPRHRVRRVRRAARPPDDAVPHERRAPRPHRPARHRPARHRRRRLDDRRHRRHRRPHRAAITPEGDVYAGLTYPKEQ